MEEGSYYVDADAYVEGQHLLIIGLQIRYDLAPRVLPRGLRCHYQERVVAREASSHEQEEACDEAEDDPYRLHMCLHLMIVRIISGGLEAGAYAVVDVGEAS